MLISSFFVMTSVFVLVCASSRAEQRPGLKRFRRRHEFGHIFCIGGGDWVGFDSCSTAPQKQAGFELSEIRRTNRSKDHRRLEARSGNNQTRGSVRGKG